MNSINQQDSSRFKIGAVARLAGVSVHTIRKWEERYEAVTPARTEGGGRVYSREDMERLVLIKKLADAGHALRELAKMPLDMLMAAWRQVPGADIAVVDESRPVRAAIVGSVAAVTLARFADELEDVDIVAAGADLSALLSRLDGREVDLLLFEAPMLSTNSDAAVRAATDAIGCEHAVVLYNFASRQDVGRLQSPWVATLKVPADADTIGRAIAALMRRPSQASTAFAPSYDADITPPRISREALARFAASAPAIECECPDHLADLVTALRAFEDYSAQCAHRSADDAELHQYLWRCAARSRAVFEEAVEHLATAEGLQLD